MVSEYGFVKTKSNALTTEAFAQWLRKREISECFIAGADAAACVKGFSTVCGVTGKVAPFCGDGYP